MGEDEVLDTNLLMEGQRGTSTILNAIEYPKSIEGSTKLLIPTRRDFFLAVEIAGALMGRGTPLPAIDIVIASMCINGGHVLKTRNTHFQAIKELYPSLKLLLEE